VGKAALHDLLDLWLGRLDTGGRGLLVVQKHLGSDSLHRWLEARDWSVTRLGSRAGYRLLEVRR
jgi:16S rRNA (guanine1207-N2)-methyltransferase